MKPAQSTTDAPAATLRKLMCQHFSEEELRALAHDLGVDFEELPGDTKTAKAIQLIQYTARRDQIVDLIEACRRERPLVDWNDVGAAAAANPRQFAFVPDDRPLINTSPDRSLKMGVVLGAIMALLLGCGFGGGLLAGQIVRVTIRPVQPDSSSLETVPVQVGDVTTTPQDAGVSLSELADAIASGDFPPGTPVTIVLDEVQATTILDELVRSSPTAPISEPHVRFLDGGTTSINFRLNSQGGRRMAVAYTSRVEGGRVILIPTSAALNIAEVPGTAFGWLPVPVATADEATQWLQGLLDQAANAFWFTNVEVTPSELGNRLTVSGTTR